MKQSKKLPKKKIKKNTSLLQIEVTVEGIHYRTDNAAFISVLENGMKKHDKSAVFAAMQVCALVGLIEDEDRFGDECTHLFENLAETLSKFSRSMMTDTDTQPLSSPTDDGKFLHSTPHTIH